MGYARELIDSTFMKGEPFHTALNRTIEEMGLTLSRLSRLSGVPYSTLYKISRGEREPNVSTIREIIQGIMRYERRAEEDFIAVIAAKHILEEIGGRTYEKNGRSIVIREYPANSIDEAIISGVEAEKDGAIAIVCAPIISNIIERIVSIPVSIIRPRKSVERAVETAIRKIYR